MNYRAEIDGLRAVAVIPVILFHAGFSIFSGGFVGVDVFFVISGYLITTIILAELATGRFSIATFYERRARRILPALFFVMAVSLPFAWMWLIPSEIKHLSDSIMAVIAFSSNILFWQTSGYFDTAVELKPLLHTWSLAVEEQYYLVFPVFLMLTWRLGLRSVGLLVLAMVAGSFVLAQIGSAFKPIATFYLLPTRGWELGMGALAAIITANQGLPTLSKRWSECLSMFGLALIAFSNIVYDKYTPFPSVYTLAPTVGTVLVILYAVPATLAGKILCFKPAVAIGLVSYSTYLWHQPLFALARQRSFHEPDVLVMSALALLSIGLGYVSWRFIETPFRNRQRFDRKTIFMLSGVGMLVFFGIGLAGNLSDGFRNREKWQGIDNAFETQAQTNSGPAYCRANAQASSLGPLVCVIGDTAKQPEGVLWGDSLAGALMLGFDNQLKREGKAFYFVSSNGCIPIEGAWRVLRREEFGCTPERHQVFVETFLRDQSLHTLVWVGAFSGLVGRVPSSDYVLDNVPVQPNRAKQKIIATLKKFKEAGKEIVFVGETPWFPHYVADYAIRRYAATNGDKAAMIQRLPRDGVIAQLNQTDLLRDALAYAAVVDGVEVFCDESRCASHDRDNQLLYIDDGHISHVGAERLAQKITSAMQISATRMAATVASRSAP